jgi:energy-coupling factor transport system ATP-binding protein
MQRAEDQFLGDTVYDDVAFGPSQTSRDRNHIDLAVRRALELVDFDLGEVAGRSPLEFSGGQRRRIAVAGLLALNPSILVLDEPFAGLDGQARNDMGALLLRLRRRGMTILTLTSELELASEASRLALLIHGEIGLIGDVRDFVANQRLCREAGIMLPEPIQLALELRDRGWNVPVFGGEGALELAIAREWRQRERA